MRHMEPGTTIIEMSTVTPTASRRLLRRLLREVCTT